MNRAGNVFMRDQLCGRVYENEETALTINGKKRKLMRNDFLRFGRNISLSEKQIENVFKKFKKYLPAAVSFIDKGFIPKCLKEEYKDLTRSRAAVLYPS